MNRGLIKVIAFACMILVFLWNMQRKAQREVSREADQRTGMNWKEKIRSLSGQISYSRHARCRMDCRQIDETEVREILESGEVNASKIEESEKGISVPLEGVTHDRQHVRIVVAPKENKLVLVTVIDLDREWSCDCP